MTRSARIPWLFVFALGAPFGVSAQGGNPFDGDPSAIRAGALLYRAGCAECHGADATGMAGPDLTSLWASGIGDEQVFRTIRDGPTGSIMPASSSPDNEIWAMVSYLKSLGTVSPWEADRGDTGRGADLFAARCSGCHMVNGGGGVLGPDLTRIARIRSPDAVEVSIRDPGASIGAGYRTVTLVTSDGRRVRGAAKGEDAFSIQVMERDQRLQGYAKSEIEEIVREDRSLMPAYPPDRLPETDLDDLLGYLGSLRNGGSDGSSSAQDAGTTGGDTGITYEDILQGFSDPTRWLTFSGDYTGQRHSPLDQITPENVGRLVPIWTFQTGTLTRGRGFETTPLVLDGVLYVTGSNNYAWALDARTGRPFWQYRRNLPQDLTYGASAPVNRGFGLLGDRLFMVTLDAYLLALDRRTGNVLWETQLADYHVGYAATVAPLVLDGMVIVGISGGEYATRGFIDAYDPVTGERIWRFHTIPGPGEPGSETWPDDPEILARGGGTTWMTGSYDPDLGLLYWGTGNPNPDYYGDDRPGDNLYTNSLVALEADTGTLRWHYQFTPHDLHDWDANQVPVLAELAIDGETRQVVMLANRNGFFYVLDRTNGELLLGEPFTETTWAREIGPDGRPIVLNDGSQGCVPDPWGGTNFMPPSYDPELETFFLTTRETCATFVPEEPELAPGRSTFGGVVMMDRDREYGALRALDVRTGERKWEFTYPSATMAGVMTTASGLVFAGDHEGNFMAFDSRTGENLWHYQTGSPIWGAAPMTHMLDGRQHVLIPSGTTLTAFALPE